MDMVWESVFRDYYNKGWIKRCRIGKKAGKTYQKRPVR